MTHEQQNEIVAHVASGATWAQAATLAGIHPEALLQAVFDLRQGKRADPTGFVKALEEAGKVATEQTLSTTRRGLKVPKNDSGQAENNEETAVCKRRPYFRRLVNLTDLRKVQVKLLRMFLSGEIDEKMYRVCVYGTATLCQTMRAIKEPATDTPPEYNLFGRLNLSTVGSLGVFGVGAEESLEDYNARLAEEATTAP